MIREFDLPIAEIDAASDDRWDEYSFSGRVQYSQGELQTHTEDATPEIAPEISVPCTTAYTPFDIEAFMIDSIEDPLPIEQEIARKIDIIFSVDYTIWKSRKAQKVARKLTRKGD